MSIKARIKHKEFLFRDPAETSRGTLYSKSVYFLILYFENDPTRFGIGECSVFPGLSMDDVAGFKEKLVQIVELINKDWFSFNIPVHNYPSINFALETALKDLKCQGNKLLFPSKFTEGKDDILINGLIWMGRKKDMVDQIKQKLKKGFKCLKLKIGALDFEEEYKLLEYVRAMYSADDIELRVDANGAFSPDQAVDILKRLAELDIHSIEQPILPNQMEEMAALCERSPLPIALDEELIGKYPVENKRQLLNTIKPQYIVLKPGLLGGIQSCVEWIDVANSLNIGWWITSSLETNIGLNAIAQWTYTLKNPIHQGLSTGTLFADNILSPLLLKGERLHYVPRNKWNLGLFST